VDRYEKTLAVIDSRIALTSERLGKLKEIKTLLGKHPDMVVEYTFDVPVCMAKSANRIADRHVFLSEQNEHTKYTVSTYVVRNGIIIHTNPQTFNAGMPECSTIMRSCGINKDTIKNIESSMKEIVKKEVF